MTSSYDSHGYVTDATYPDKFFRELSPTWLSYVAALGGAAPRRLTEPFTYLELGCGFGHSTIANAGAFPRAEFHACDINPEHVAGAQRHAAALGIDNVAFHRAPFEALAERNLPAFDFIVLHGVYSWVDADARRAIRRVLDAKLKVGGFVYLSYNCLPGWASEAPLRKLLVELAATALGDSAQRSATALQSLQALRAAKGRFFAANPEAASAVDAYEKGSSNYLAHEFLNRAWEPFYSIDVADELAEAGLSYVGSATLAENHPPLIVDDAAAEAVAKLPTPRQRRLALDFATNQRFRRDVFVRGRAELDPAAIARNLNAVVIGSLRDPDAIGNAARVPRGEIRFQEDFVRELRALLAPGSITIGEAVAALGGPKRVPAEIARNLLYLVAAGTLWPFSRAHGERSEGKPRRPANAVVANALALAVEQRAPRAIPSEVLGNGVELSALEALAVAAYLEDAHDVDALTARLATSDARPADRRSLAERTIDEIVPMLARVGLLA